MMQYGFFPPVTWHGIAAKVYHPEHVTSFPPELSQLSANVLRVLGFDRYRAEAAIVNYYHLV